MATAAVKVIVKLHEGESAVTTKLWRFYGEGQEYSLQRVKTEVLSLYPHLLRKELDVTLWHEDALVAKVDLAK